MGFLDILNGMQNGPRGETRPGQGGMSPITMAILALLAYKGIKHFGGQQNQAPAGNALPPGGGRLPNPNGGPGWGRMQESAPNVPGQGAGQTTGGGLGDILGGLFGGRGAAPTGGGGFGRGGLGGAMGGGGGLGGMLGGLLAGGAAGSVLSGGLGSLLEGFRQNGHGAAADSWVSRGPNQDISESDLARAIGSEDLDELSRHTGLSRNDLLSGLRQELPGAIDEMTPDGRLPSEDEVGRWV